jgi:hypothetical protein
MFHLLENDMDIPIAGTLFVVWLLVHEIRLLIELIARIAKR